ncbi:hypothetical protein [Kribbella solani]|uniref:Uncharacterized protein n=1 Tax=Kribbella solani TaxID=236067 RepID=A0A841DSM5_9ACTN|nr:hypothetical protein [Kribbella solani]MBB5979885.1 hypothetical protein [Kribbella solani]
MKPDALGGATSVVDGKLAGDFCMHLAGFVNSEVQLNFTPNFENTIYGAELARRHVGAEADAFSWYKWPITDGASCQARLVELAPRIASRGEIKLVEIVQCVSLALGFEETMSTEHVLSVEDYMAFYRYTNRPDLHPRMQDYLVGKRVRLIMMCGQQENSALQAMKTFLRRVMLHHTGKSNGGNWIHVTNPDVPNYPELLRLYAGL